MKAKPDFKKKVRMPGVGMSNPFGGDWFSHAQGKKRQVSQTRSQPCISHGFGVSQVHAAGDSQGSASMRGASHMAKPS